MRGFVFSSLLAVVLGLVLLLSACSTEPETSSEGAIVLAEQLSYPIMELDAQGMKQILAENKGKAVFLCFWSVSCSACEKEIPELETLVNMFGPDKLKLMLINLDPTADAISVFFGNYTPVSEQYHGSADLGEAYGVFSIPHVVLYDTVGDVFLNKAGFFPARMLQALVERASKEEG